MIEKLLRARARFNTDKGLITTEDVYTLNLASLDKVAKLANAELKEARKSEEEESFISRKPSNDVTNLLSDKLEFLKHVIGIKLKEETAREEAKIKAKKYDKLAEALDKAENNELSKMTPDQIREAMNSL